jgi:hypothetical protein
VTEPVAPYQVSYSERVLQRIRELAAEATQRGDGEQFAAALKEFHRRLCIYPQFGDPILDLVSERGQIYNGIIRPLALRYGVYEDRRLVVVIALPNLLPIRAQEPGSETE